MKCIKCGCENLDGAERCKNCEYPLNKKKHNRKNFFLYFFLFLYSFVIPYLILLLSADEITNFILFIAGTLHFFAEIFAICTTKSLFHTKENFNKIILNYDLFCLIVYLLFYSFFVAIGNYSLSLILSVLKIISYFISKRFILKNRILLKKWKYVLIASYIIFLFVITNIFYPTSLNKFLFLKFGTTDFSSKELQILLIDGYSNKPKSYFNSLSSKELRKINSLETDVYVNDNDLKKISNLTSLTFKNFKGDIILDNSYLEKLIIDKSNINNLNLQNSINKISINNSEINDLKILNMNTLKDVEINYSNVNDIQIINNSKLYDLDILSEVNNVLLENNLNIKECNIKAVNNLIYKGTKSFYEFIDSDNYVKFKKINFNDIEFSLNSNQYIRLEHSSIDIPENTLVKELNIKNITYKIVDYYGNEVKNIDNVLDGKYVEFYDNDILVNKVKFNYRSDL